MWTLDTLKNAITVPVFHVNKLKIINKKMIKNKMKMAKNRKEIIKTKLKINNKTNLEF